MVRQAAFLAILSAFLAHVGVTQASVTSDLNAPPPKLNGPNCPQVQAAEPVQFAGRTLIEAPDLPPELRLMSALLTEDCEERLHQLSRQYLATHPGDYLYSFIKVRLELILHDIPRAKAAASQVLQQHPDFSSMQVLMASLAIAEQNFDQAQEILDRVDKLQPQDLWAYVDRLRIQAKLLPSSAVAKQVSGIIKSADFPLEARRVLYVDVATASEPEVEADDEASEKPGDSTRCARIKARRPIRFDGHLLVEAPDLPPELRLINTLLSEHCSERARQIQNQYLARNTDDYRMSFIAVQQDLMQMETPKGKATAKLVLQQHPDFSSMLELMASVAVTEKDFPRARELLDHIGQLQPDDLGAYADRLRMALAQAPSPALLKQATEIIQNADFPAEIRQELYSQAHYIAPPEEHDKMFAGIMKNPDTASDCILFEQAVVLAEGRNDPQGAARLIEDTLNSAGCTATPRVRILLAEAYLLEAVQLAPLPNGRNAALVEKALRLLNGNLTPLAQRVATRSPTLDPLVPFLKGYTNSRTVDGYGFTSLCTAARYFNATMVTAELENGADPNQICDRSSPVHRLITTPFSTPDRSVPLAQAVLRVLLEHGARIEPQDMASCVNPDNGKICKEAFLPILQEFEQRRAQSRSTL